MPKLAAIKSKEFIKIIESLGFVLKRTSSSHMIFRNPKSGARAVVPFHLKEITKGTLSAILRESGLSKEDISG